MAHATFYTVNGPRGEYYAVRNHETKKIWTERTELAARQQARDERLEFVGEEAIDHIHLLDLMIAVPYTPPVDRRSAAGDSTRITVKFESGISRFFRRLRGPDGAAGKGADAK
jgi:hypothetical protein